uniref:Golgin subfamily A member 7/ERF4 domain-containing protein n=1 Tax=Electrophorus electricus TaxID=8005 RepID=A0A4W4E3M8_ELEEL
MNFNKYHFSLRPERIVFIQRDYRDGTVCKFQTKFPEELDNRIERALFEDTIKTLNNYYAEAEKISGQSYLEGCLACASAYIIFLCMETRYEKVLRCTSFNMEIACEYKSRGVQIRSDLHGSAMLTNASISVKV